jgi:hypothetical protein
MDQIICDGGRNSNLWATVNKLMHKTEDTGAIQNMDPNDINNYFASVSKKNTNHPIHSIQLSPQAEFENLFIFLDICHDSLHHSWKRMKKKSKTSVDPLCMSNRMLGFA